MSLQSQLCRIDYAGDSLTSSFDTTFKIFQAKDLAIFKRSALGVITKLVLTTDYTVAGVGNRSGSTVTLTAGALPAGVRLTILRIRELTQDAQIRNQGTFYPEVHEDVFDILTMGLQQLQEQYNRTIKLPVSVRADEFDSALNVLAAKDRLLFINGDGTAFQYGPTYTEFMDALDNIEVANGVTKFNGRIGIVSPQPGDYTATIIGSAAVGAITATNVQAALAQINTIIANLDLLPAQGGNSGKFLSTNGTVSSWQTVDALPSQTGNNGKVLTTNGTAASWIANDPAMTVSSVQTLTGGQTITVAAVNEQRIRVAGSSGPTPVLLPNPTIDGQKLWVQGASNANPIVIVETGNIAQDGATITLRDYGMAMYIGYLASNIWVKSGGNV